MCLYPRLIQNPKFKKNKKNGGNIPPVNDIRTTMVPIGCQNCMECRKQKAREWQARLTEDIKTNTNGKFITLTFSNASIAKITAKIEERNKRNGIQPIHGYELDNATAIYATRHYLERWRKEYRKSQRHWLITELGHNGTENIHLHGIIWTDQTYDDIEKHWQYGYIWPRKYKNKKEQWIRYPTYVNEKTVNYITKYVNKTDEINTTYKPIILTSAGIGNNYTNTQDSQKNKYNNNKTIETYRTRQGTKIALPIYWRNKIYTDQEKEKLWIQKLDKQVRYVLGEKISIKKGEEEYNKALKWAQRKNIRLHYNSGEKDWTKEQYERERRILKIKERIHASGRVIQRI